MLFLFVDWKNISGEKEKVLFFVTFSLEENIHSTKNIIFMSYI